MPTPVLDNLTSESSTRDLLNALLAYHHARGPALAVARMALESATDALAKGTGVAERVVLTDPERDISIGAFFGGMDRAQAGRFLDELFVDMIPHLANQRSVMRDLHQGQTPSGMAVRPQPRRGQTRGSRLGPAVRRRLGARVEHARSAPGLGG